MYCVFISWKEYERNGNPGREEKGPAGSVSPPSLILLTRGYLPHFPVCLHALDADRRACRLYCATGFRDAGKLPHTTTVYTRTHTTLMTRTHVHAWGSFFRLPRVTQLRYNLIPAVQSARKLSAREGPCGGCFGVPNEVSPQERHVPCSWFQSPLCGLDPRSSPASRPTTPR